MRLWRLFWGLPVILRIAIVLLALFGALSINWNPGRVQSPPTLVDRGRVAGSFRAGAARVSLDPPFPTPIAGFTTRGDKPFEGMLDHPAVRGLVVEVDGHRVGLVSAELLLIPAALRQKVKEQTADLHLDELFVGATHTHSGIGGYWNSVIAEWSGMGRYDARIEAFVAGQIAAALHQAAGRMKPVRVSTGAIDASNFAFNRVGGPAVDNRMTAARWIALDGTPVANLVIYAAHPTIVPWDEMRVSGDWPGALSTSLESNGGPPTLFFQGAVGDVTWGKRGGEMSWEDRVFRYGEAVAGDARGALAAGGEGDPSGTLAWARVRVELPPCDLGTIVPWFVNGAASKVACWFTPAHTTDVSFLRIGRLELAGVPGEAVASLGISWRAALGGAMVTSLVDDYVGYIEAPIAIEKHEGEARHSYYGPSLAPVLLDALKLARTSATPE